MGEKKGKNTVFYVSLIIVGIIAVWSVAFNDSFTVVANAAFKVLTGKNMGIPCPARPFQIIFRVWKGPI